jgi:predicted Holliday junction resolvase-like endonuclease
VYFLLKLGDIMNRYEKMDDEGRKFPIVMILIIIALIVMGALFYIESMDDEVSDDVISESMKIPEEKIESSIEAENLLDSRGGESAMSVEDEAQARKDEKTAKFLDDLSQEAESLALEDSDAVFKGAVGQVSEGLAQWFGTKGVIKKNIFLINDISQNQILAKNRKFLKPPQKIEVQKDANGLYLGEKSYKRYDAFTQAINHIDVQKGAGIYRAFEPLFSQVYQVFSYPDAYQLDDIFLKAAANIIKAPVIEGRIGLIKHSLLYKFKDKKLEGLSAVEKQMLRMGPENTRVIQAKLRVLVEAILAGNE